MKPISIIKNSDDIFEALSQRKQELKLTNLDIALDAEKHGVKTPLPSLSTYFSRKSNSTDLSEKAILWLCARYCVDVKISVNIEEYSEFSSNLKLKLKYPK